MCIHYTMFQPTCQGQLDILCWSIPYKLKVFGSSGYLIYQRLRLQKVLNLKPSPPLPNYLLICKVQRGAALNSVCSYLPLYVHYRAAREGPQLDTHCWPIPFSFSFWVLVVSNQVEDTTFKLANAFLLSISIVRD